MTLTTFLQQCLTGISLGGAYALIAIGYTMVYGILRLINFAHGEIFMMSGYFMIFSMAVFPWYISIPVTIIGTVVLGVVIEKAAYAPLRQSPRMSVMISGNRRFLFPAKLCDISFFRIASGISGDFFLKA